MKTKAVSTSTLRCLEAPGAELRRVAGSMLVAALAMLMGACGSAPTQRFHSLLPAEPPAAQVAYGATVTVALAPIELPAQVDQPQWVVRLADGSLAVLEQERWVGTLRDEMRQALLERLAAGYGVIEARTSATPATLRVAIQLLRFDSVIGREARLEGYWLITPAAAGSSATRCAWIFREAAGQGIDAMAQAQRAVVAQLADSLGRAVRENPGPCPSGAPSR